MKQAANLAGQRWHSLRAMIALATARLLVTSAPFSVWRRSLGDLVEQPTDHAMPTASDRLHARFLARRVERAALRLPGASKCLPRAMALQWLMHRAGLPSRLVIAMHRHDREGDHVYHAWVEAGGEMLVGHCERAEYLPLACFDQVARGAAAIRRQTEGR